MNRINIIGNLVEKPQLKYTNSNIAVSQFTLAVARMKEGTDFIKCQAWGKQAENLCNYMDKGNKIAVDGRLQTSTYDKQDGTKGYTTDVYVQNIEFLEKKKSETQNGTQATQNNELDPYASFGEQVDLDNFLD